VAETSDKVVSYDNCCVVAELTGAKTGAVAPATRLIESGTTDAELRHLAAELQQRLTAEQCRRLAELLNEAGGP